MKNFLRAALLINGVIDGFMGLVLIFLPKHIANLLGYPELPQEVNFIIGGWGVAALIFGTGRILASLREGRYRLWAFLGFLEGIVLLILCLRYWLGHVLIFRQVSLPLIVALVFSVAYAVLYPTWSKLKD